MPRAQSDLNTPKSSSDLHVDIGRVVPVKSIYRIRDKFLSEFKLNSTVVLKHAVPDAVRIKTRRM